MLINNDDIQKFKEFQLAINDADLADIQIQVGPDKYKISDKHIAEFKYVGLSPYYIVEEILSNTTLEILLEDGVLIKI